MLFPKFCHTGNHVLDSIQTFLYLTETSCPGFSVNYKLTSKEFSSSDFLRENVYLVLQVLMNSLNGLLTLEKQKCLPNFVEVAKYKSMFYI